MLLTRRTVSLKISLNRITFVTTRTMLRVHTNRIFQVLLIIFPNEHTTYQVIEP